jgi:hypothetical protein
MAGLGQRLQTDGVLQMLYTLDEAIMLAQAYEQRACQPNGLVGSIAFSHQEPHKSCLMVCLERRFIVKGVYSKVTLITSPICFSCRFAIKSGE